MCGIFCIITNGEDGREVFQANIDNLIRRGPDSLDQTIIKPYGTNSLLKIQIYASVLCCRPTLVAQPIFHGSNVLVWNGEVFGGLPSLEEIDNDADVLLRCLAKETTVEGVLSVLKLIEGPFAFIFFHVRMLRLKCSGNIIFYFSPNRTS